jgi:hypothetical protein
MKYPGYWVAKENHGVSISRYTFDETELDPATQWTQAWQNQDPEALAIGYLSLEAAQIAAAQLLAKSEGVPPLSQSESERARRFEPTWDGDRCEIASLSKIV